MKVLTCCELKNSNEKFIKKYIAVHQTKSCALHYDDNKCKLKYFNIQSIWLIGIDQKTKIITIQPWIDRKKNFPGA